MRGAISLTLPLEATDRATGASGWVLAVISLAVVIVGGTLGYRLVAVMAAQVADSEQTLNTLATTDALTGISNRRAVMQRLAEEIARGGRAGYPTGVIELDADHFKRVNDVHGHAAGDEVLRQIAARLSGAVREYDAVGRLGGEEFLVVAPGIGVQELRELAERIRASVKAEPILHEDREIDVTVSVGATLARADDTAESALARADVALYAAKDAGRDRVETH